jgi:ABC-2 type transport system permease protein
MYVVFVHFLRFGQGIAHFASTLLLGIVLWGFFAEATTQGMQAIVNRGDLLRKINFPKYLLVISATISALINLVLNLCIVLVIMLVDGVDFGWSSLVFPVTLLLLYGFSLALAFLLAAVNVKYRDVAHIWEIFLQAMFYATPIIYPLQTVMMFNEDAAKFLMLNPVAVLLQDARAQLVGHDNVITASQIFSSIVWLSVPYAVMALTVVFATWYFRSKQGKFAEMI